METSLENRVEPAIDWGVPQRQPGAGLFLVLIKTIGQMLKRMWPVLLLILFRGKAGEFDKYEIIASALLVVTLVVGVLQYFFFRFYISENNLVVKKGFIKKQTVIVPLQKIQTVQIESSLIHNLLGIVKLSVDTAGSTKTEVTIPALKETMALQLRSALENREMVQAATVEKNDAVVRLTVPDLARLSISSNHLEAFFILLSFVFGVYENLKQFNENLEEDTERFIPAGTMTVLLSMVIVVLVITMIISTVRVLFRFFDFTVRDMTAGFHIKYGLINTHEHVVPFKKIQFISWKANWIRKAMNIRMLEYHVTGGEEMKKKMRVLIPVTNEELLPSLVAPYDEVSMQSNDTATRMHFSYVIRRTIMAGIIPAAILFTALWFRYDWYAFYAFILPLYIGISSCLYYRRFRVWSMPGHLMLHKGYLGSEMVIFKWYKLQNCTLSQSIFQRKKGLANLTLYTAAGKITLRYIPVNKASEILNYALYKTESTNEAWM